LQAYSPVQGTEISAITFELGEGLSQIEHSLGECALEFAGAKSD